MMMSRTESVLTGTEGGHMDITCNYPDGYQHTPMYFCRDPCKTSHVLIEAEKVDVPVSKGRYTAIKTVSPQSFFVTIEQLTLRDRGVYYCGLSKWFFDILIKVNVHVSKGKQLFFIN